MTKSKNFSSFSKKIYRLIKNKYFWLCFIFILIFSSISYVFFTGNYWRWESQYYDNLRNERYKQTADNFDKTILTYGYDNKTLKLSLKEIRDAFKKELLKEEILRDAFKEEFDYDLFFDDFIFFQWDFFGDDKHYLNNVNDIFNKKIKVD